jgi:hypothetical protein
MTRCWSPSERVARLWASGALVAGALVAAAGCDPANGEPGSRVVPAAPASVQELSSIPDSAFARMVGALSEPGGYFDTDNLISNEASYLHVVDALDSRGVAGGAYLGVGPGQNFSYITAIRPGLAFMVDVRRDNLLQHLWFKALFEGAETRLDYLCAMVARACGGQSAGLSIEALVARVDASDPAADPAGVVRVTLDDAAAAGVPLSEEDLRYIASIHQRFIASGLDLRFNTHGRAPQSYYPTFRGLLLERDRTGRQASYLSDEPAYAFLRAMQRANRVVPVVGDLAGDHAIRAIGDEVRRRGLDVSAFYVSNVEFYLFGDGLFPRYIANLESLPVRSDAVIIRSYFNRFRPIPGTVAGYASTQLLQEIPALLTDWEAGRIRSYGELVARSR